MRLHNYERERWFSPTAGREEVHRVPAAHGASSKITTLVTEHIIPALAGFQNTSR